MSDYREYIDGLVSIIVPVYNSEKYLAKAIDSVRGQTYRNWELLLVDDCSTDRSVAIVQEYVSNDPRVKHIQLASNSGAAVARNEGLKAARGRYIAYLDADDLWMSNKLERQIAFLTENNVSFSCCDYEKIDHDGTPLYKQVHMPSKMTYNQLLKNTIIQTVGVIIDTRHVDVALLEMPNVRRGQDYATWLQVLRSGVVFYGQNEVLAVYRRVPTSLSANKLKAMKRTWNVYRNLEHLSLPYAIWCQICHAYYASKKRIYIRKFFRLQFDFKFDQIPSYGGKLHGSRETI